jgi:hypothetical protein
VTRTTARSTSATKASADATGSCKNPPNTENDQCCLPHQVADRPAGHRFKVTKDGAGGSLEGLCRDNSQTVGLADQRHRRRGRCSVDLLGRDVWQVRRPGHQAAGPPRRGLQQAGHAAGRHAVQRRDLPAQAVDRVGRPAQGPVQVNPPDIEGAAKADVFSRVRRVGWAACAATPSAKRRAPSLPEGMWTSDKIQGSDRRQVAAGLRSTWTSSLASPVRLCFGFDAGDSFANSRGLCQRSTMCRSRWSAAKARATLTPSASDSCGELSRPACALAASASVSPWHWLLLQGGRLRRRRHLHVRDVRQRRPVRPTTWSARPAARRRPRCRTDFESSAGKLPTGWKASLPGGSAARESSKAYSKLVTWTVSPVKAYQGGSATRCTLAPTV